jgi:23S rRNA (cytosine1962-C5)-methyltransferase
LEVFHGSFSNRWKNRAMPPPRLIAHLKKDRDKPVRHGHPWIFSGAIARWEGDRSRPGPADVVNARGEWIARGLAHPASNLAVRVFTRDAEQPVDEDFLARQVDQALDLRAELFGPAGLDGDTDAYRLVFAEADGLSGLIVDRYADVLSARVSAAALMPYLPFLLEHLAARTGLRRMLVTAERDAQEREGLDAAQVERHSRNAPPAVRIRESGLAYDVDVAGGQKTGFYLDQRDSRRRVAAYAARRRVLSAYCYTGSFELHAARAGAAHITGLDASEPALAAARRHHELNGLATPVEYRAADVPDALRRFRDAGRQFDLIILDPPRFVANASQLDKGLRAYKDINLLGLKLLTPGGILATFSCSGLVSAEQLQLTLSWAATDAQREVQVLETCGQPADHPVRLSFPESAYLHGLICRVI